MSDAKDYITKREIPQLFECLMTGLMYHRPSDHVAYLQDCLEKIKARGLSSVRWDMFLEAKRTRTPQLPPVTPPQKGSRPSSRASSKAESLFDSKKAVLPPIATVGGPRVPPLSRPIDRPVLLVIGGPGSGKSRVARALAERYGYRLVSAGALVRATRPEVAAAGDLAPDVEVLAAVVGAVNEALQHHVEGFVIEGYPRSLAQLENYLEHIHRVDTALLLDYEESSLQSRLLRGGDVPAIARRLSAFKTACLPACRALDDDGKLLVLAVHPEEADDESVAREAARLLDAVLTPTTPPPQPPPQPQPQPEPLTSIRQLTGVDLSTAAARGAQDPALVLLLGGPGSGRTTCLERLARVAGVQRVDAADCGDDIEAVAGRLRKAAAAAAGGSAGVVVLEGFPETEAGLRAMLAAVGAPDLAVLVDCFEEEMLSRLAAHGGAGGAAGKMKRFKEETLPVVQWLDQAGRLCVVQGSADPDSVLKEVKALVDFVAHGQADARVAPENQTVAAALAAALKARRVSGGAADDDDQAAAAAKIQAGFRGYQTRKQLAQRK